jgi:hypothetical protein
MKPEWGSAQLRAARMGKLAFTSEQLSRIKGRFGEQGLARVNSGTRGDSK